MPKYDKYIASLFAVLIVLFLILSVTNDSFFSWAYSRHQNQLSWYIRPIFIIPFCYFSYKHSWSGLMGTIFLLLTSMFWFPKPDIINEDVKQFLQYEKEWLGGEWTLIKTLMVLLVPFSLSALALAFWKRSIWIGLSVVVLIAVGKILWSILSAGQSGQSIIVPAVIGLFICICLIYFGFNRLEKMK